jgi:hypothetical protein
MEVREGGEEYEISREANKVENRGQCKFLEFEKEAQTGPTPLAAVWTRKRQATRACLLFKKC